MKLLAGGQAKEENDMLKAPSNTMGAADHRAHPVRFFDTPCCAAAGWVEPRVRIQLISLQPVSASQRR